MTTTMPLHESGPPLPGSPPRPVVLPTPYTVVIDSREQRPFTFTRPLSGLRGKRFAVQSTVACLPSGDYSLAGMESQIAVERKSLSDLYGTLGQGRGRFLRELARLAEFEFAAVVIEEEWSVILGSPPARSRLLPKTIFHSVAAWQQRFPRVHWWTCPGRDFAEGATLRILDRFWRERQVRP